MHELAVTERILAVILKHAGTNNVNKVLSIQLKMGELSDLEDEWVQKYFDYLSKGTIAENAKLKIERIPVVMECDNCGQSFEVDIRKIKEIVCPECANKKCSLISGKEYYIKDMEVI
ncbi:MAG: hydrogenase maturation nickel metallochaperone HypA [Deltaproteobacteria bacterium]|nr:hydrogenase maturation nickel metallochaperone HypA [Deltaproteobacteria bacterium]MBW2323678.1 hydrogenase maturation nickel metallochaperone HypA [Deltaproteobacteria bacterium]